MMCRAVGLHWNRVSGLETSGQRAETLPLGRRRPTNCRRLRLDERTLTYSRTFTVVKGPKPIRPTWINSDNPRIFVLRMRISPLPSVKTNMADDGLSYLDDIEILEIIERRKRPVHPDRANDLRVYSGSPGWVGRRHFSRC
ncbi:hypothetical protein AVEN_160952-1 [Araneus ventricosus]|uniref:Uncharacterized protein n=1 Tax=Araneus ventricosus TaxID=182803 RepID=A0A4Y2VH87_ARAVE|nr:hypothetical protein AVEN_160952-1 [Araneus ventricosus]